MLLQRIAVAPKCGYLEKTRRPISCLSRTFSLSLLSLSLCLFAILIILLTFGIFLREYDVLTTYESNHLHWPHSGLGCREVHELARLYDE